MFTKDWIASILKVVKLGDQLVDVREICATDTEKYEAEVIWLSRVSLQRILLHKKAAETLKYGFGAVVSLPAFLKLARQKGRRVTQERDA